jgi:DNA invertase Pin-like site-specific DNA recombinase
MQRKYGLGVPRAGLVALAVALVLTLLPATAVAAGVGQTTTTRSALVPITQDATPALAQGAGYWRPAAAQRTIGIEARRVAALQRLLTRLGKRPGPVDGLFGPLTEAGVIRFQRAAGVAVDGIVGRQTARALLAATRWPTAQPASRRNRDNERRAQFVAARPPTPVGIGASVTDAAAPGQEEEVKPELMLAVFLPLLLASVLLGALRGRVIPLRKAKPDGSVQPSTGPLAPVRRLRPVTTGHTGVRERGKPEQREAVRAIGYVSVASNGPPERRQIQAIAAACETHGWQLVEIVRDVEKDDPSSRRRPGLARTLRRVESGEASCVIVWALPQLSPVVTELGTTLRSIGRSGARFISLEDKIDTAEAAGRKAANVIVSVSAWEHQRLGERTRKGLAAARAKGGSISRPSVQDVPRLKEYIAEMRAEGMTLQAIADTLNDEGVPTLRGGQKWRPSSVQAAAGYRRPKR